MTKTLSARSCLLMAVVVALALAATLAAGLLKPAEALAGQDLTKSQYTNLGANHYMQSDVTLRSNGHIDAKTRTWTSTLFGGYTGAVQVIFYDENDVAIGMSQAHSFGVDGKWIGRSDRTDYWSEDIAPDVAARTARMDILHYWAPRYSAINNIVKHAVEVGQTAGPLLEELKKAGLIP